MCQLKYKPNVDMELLHVRILNVYTLIASMEARQMGLRTRALNMPFRMGCLGLILPIQSFLVLQTCVKNFRNFVKNGGGGGQCEMTPECGAMCRCWTFLWS